MKVFLFALLAAMGNALFVYGQRGSQVSNNPFYFLQGALTVCIGLFLVCAITNKAPLDIHYLRQSWGWMILSGLGFFLTFITFIGFHWLYSQQGATNHIVYALLSILTTSIGVGLIIFREPFNRFHVISGLLAVAAIIFYGIGQQKALRHNPVDFPIGFPYESPSPTIPSIMSDQQPVSFDHQTPGAVGILLTNLGTPDSYRPGDVRRYLKEFLWDHRVVEVPRPIWWFVLNLVILNTRPRKSAKAYEKVWTEKGSPLLSISRDQLNAVSSALQQADQSRDNRPEIHVELAMRYGNPSIENGLQALKDKGANRVLILPLYPQYSATTTASTFDAVAAVIAKWRWIPELRFINHYHDDDGYINALANQIKQHWQNHGKAEHLLMSFHGIPQAYFEAGDPYHCECHKTGRLLAEKLQLTPEQWSLSFQSRLGPKQWLKPYTDHTLQAMPAKGIKNIQVVCPGFSADCLETLEEIAMENKDTFIAAGGEGYDYIPCLNDCPEHIEALKQLILKHTQGWDTTTSPEELSNRKKAAVAMGAKC